MKDLKIIIFSLIWIVSCTDNPIEEIDESNDSHLTIFFVNDQHGQLENFSKIKYIADLEERNSNVIVACSGDIFSGNPIVDNHPDKGYPIIDIMNKVGFDISVLGNHEFDYGEEILRDRMEQAAFPWVCANVDMVNSVIPEPPEYHTIDLPDMRVTFLGLVETNGNNAGTIPSTHPWKIKNLKFQKSENILSRYQDVKEQEDADLLVALTHLGHNGSFGRFGDFQLAHQFAFFDLIIGGHSHHLLDTVVNNIPIFQAGRDLNYLGKISISMNQDGLNSIQYEQIDLNSYPGSDPELEEVIDDYNASMPELEEVIGFSSQYHDRSKVGCFYTDALRDGMDVDVSFQNSGGIRSNLDEGEITKREIYEIAPFNNGTIKYNMTVQQIKTFIQASSSGYFYAGIEIDQTGEHIIIKNLSGEELSDDTILLIGINDYIPAVLDMYFPDNGIVQSLTAAETLIYYLESGNGNVNYTGCHRYFKYQ